jgi:restriction endonuclease S subunit
VRDELRERAIKLFVIRRSQLRGRLDAEYNYALLSTVITSRYVTAKLRDISWSRTGGTPSTTRSNYWQGDIPWASPKDFKDFFLTDTEDHISEEAVSDSSTTIVPEGTLLVVFRSGILRHSLPVTITTKPTAINQDVKALTFRDDISAEYVGAYLSVFGTRLLPLITKSGATVQSINAQQFEELEIPIPPISVQEDLVSILVGGYRQKDALEQSAHDLTSRVDDIVLQELGVGRIDEPKSLSTRIFRIPHHTLSGARWDPNYLLRMSSFLKQLHKCPFPVHKLKDFVGMIQYGISERATAGADGIPILRMLNLQDGGWDVSDLKYIQLDDHTRQAFRLQQGDILFNRTNSKELVGKCAIFNLDGDYVFASYLVRVRIAAQSGLLPEYVVAYLGSSLGRKQIDAVSRQIAGMSNINAEEIRELLIPIPPPAMQDRICQKVSELRQRAIELHLEAATQLEKAKHKIEHNISSTRIV